MALHAAFDTAHIATRNKRREAEAHDLAPKFWTFAIPACLLFWAVVAYGIHSAL